MLAEARKDALSNSKTTRRWTKASEARFFEELALTANIRHSASTAGMTPCAAHRRRQADPAFAAKWLEALDAGYAELEMLMLRQSLEGAERTETVSDADGAIKQKKVVRSFSPMQAMRLLQAHRETVERYRIMAAGTPDEEEDAAVTRRVRAEMARVRERLGYPADE